MDHRHLISESWRIIGASVVGRSHELSETRCQDAHRVVVLPHVSGEIVIAAVADGAGSAAYSHIGALTAVTSATDLVRQRAAASDTLQIQRDDIVPILRLVRDTVAAEAREREHDLRDLASTLLLLVVLPERALAAHIGDGAVVVDDGALRVLSWPDQGEYANMTTFLTSDDAIETARIYETGAIRRFALFSDGLQGLALSYVTQSLFAPFMESMLKPLAQPDTDPDKLEIALADYLASEVINSRTDDDKTLVLGIRTGAVTARPDATGDADVE